MPRGDQLRRQWLLLAFLQSRRGGATLQELADSLPEDYPRHPRTIRRDLEALESVYPLITERVDGRTRWMILEDFRNLPAPAFTSTELMALTFSRNLLRSLQGTPIQVSLDSAFHKITAAASHPNCAFGAEEQAGKNFPPQTPPIFARLLEGRIKFYKIHSLCYNKYNNDKVLGQVVWKNL
jgi:predicted DNA-binding transcriptional regulator YafY